MRDPASYLNSIHTAMCKLLRLAPPSCVSTLVPYLLQTLLLHCRLCCLCGTAIMSNPSNMCVNCIRSQVDITAPIQKQVSILWCKECNRYLQPPKNWVRAELESKELLTFCVKRTKGLQKVIGHTLHSMVLPHIQQQNRSPIPVACLHFWPWQC